MNPRCYVASPSGKKYHGNIEIDFDEIYRTLIYPSAARAILRPFDVVTLNECMTSNSPISDTAIQLIIGSPFMICDTTTDNPNVIYELGVRHASAPGGTVIIRQQIGQVPFYLRNVFIHFYKFPVSDNELPQQVADLVGVINKIYCDKSSNPVYRNAALKSNSK